MCGKICLKVLGPNPRNGCSNINSEAPFQIISLSDNVLGLAILLVNSFLLFSKEIYDIKPAIITIIKKFNILTLFINNDRKTSRATIIIIDVIRILSLKIFLGKNRRTGKTVSR